MIIRYKNKLMKNFILAYLCLLLSFSLNSCSLDIKSENEFSDPYAITNPEVARELLASIYHMYPQYQYDLSLLSDDFYSTYAINQSSDVRNYYGWRGREMSLFSSDMWTNYYSTIAICNVLIERIPLINTSYESEKKKLDEIEAEVNILKAMCYFDLLRLFAPAFSSTEDQDGIILKNNFELDFPRRSSIKESVEEIKKLLLVAVNVENNPSKVTWLSQCAGFYLLAELSLYYQNFDDAIKYAHKVLEKYPIENISENNYNNLWENAHSEERIFAFSLSDPYYENIEYSKEDGDIFYISDKLSFEHDDYRRHVSTITHTYTLNTGTQKKVNLLGKYNKLNKNDEGIKYLNRMSVEGVYFILLESLASKKDATAMTLLNNYLQARGIKPIAEVLSNSELINAILKYKHIAFVGEGERYYDLKRTGCDNLVRCTLFGENEESVIRASDYRWTFPIPRSELKYNPNVTQNRGWSI